MVRIKILRINEAADADLKVIERLQQLGWKRGDTHSISVNIHQIQSSKIQKGKKYKTYIISTDFKKTKPKN